MKQMQDLIKSFDDRAVALRKEITEAIIGLLKDNNLTELKLSQHPDRVPWVVWFDNRNTGYDSRVTQVSLYGKGIAVEVYDQDCCCSAVMISENCDLACTNIDWLCRILDGMVGTLSLPKSCGTAEVSGCAIEWSYDEPGLAELPEEDLEQIESDMQKGKQTGDLCYTDDDEVEFNGTWKLKQTNTQ